MEKRTYIPTHQHVCITKLSVEHHITFNITLLTTVQNLSRLERPDCAAKYFLSNEIGDLFESIKMSFFNKQVRPDVHFQSIPIILLYLCRFRYQPSQISAHLNSHTYRTYSMSLIVDWLINNPPLNGSTNMLLYNNSLITYYCNLIFDL